MCISYGIYSCIMCYAPINIRNNSLTYRPGIDKLYFTVPCGKCRECQQRKRDDWFLRAYYEWKKYNEHGEVIFITLTYNDWSKPFVSFADVSLQVLDQYVADLYQYAVSPSDSKFVPKTVHTIEYYEKEFGVPFPISHYDFVQDFGECVDRFNKKHVQDFFKSFRQYLHTRKIYTYDEQSVTPIKYFAVSEYGGEYHRQHVHVLLYLPKKWHPDIVKKWCEICWSDKVKSTNFPPFVRDTLVKFKQNSFNTDKDIIFSTPGSNWRDWRIVYEKSLNRYSVYHLKGFCMYSKDNPPIIESGAGIEYVMKYLYKADKFLSEDKFRKLKTWLELFPAYSTIAENKKLVQALTSLNDVFPFYLSSQKLGESLYDELSAKTSDELVKFLSTPKPLNMTENAKFYSVPQYILNRLLYNGVDTPLSDNTTRLLTPVGYDSVCKMFDVKLFSLAQSFAEQARVGLDFLTIEDRYKYFEKTGKNIQDVIKLVPNYRALAHYHLVWQNVAPKVPDNDKMLWSSNDFFKESRSLYFQQKAPSFEFGQNLKGYSYISMQRLSSNCFNTYPAFKHYDDVINALFFIRECVGVRDARHEFDDEQKVSKYRECIKKFKYV